MILDANGKLVWFHQLAPPTSPRTCALQRYGRPARADLVAGRRSRRGVRARRGRDRRHAPTARSATVARRQRLPDGPARVRAHAATATRCSRSTRRSSFTCPARPRARFAAARRDRPGGRRRDRARGLGMARLRPHPARRLATRRPPTAPPTTPTTSTRSRRWRRPRADLGARHVGDLRDRPRERARSSWTLGGKASSFRLGRGARFNFQHDAQMLPGNGGRQHVRRRGRPAAEGALLARADPQARPARAARATVARQYHAPERHLGPERGQRADARRRQRVRRLRLAAVLLASSRPTGRLLFDASLPQDDGSYRAYRFPWSATPKTRPDVAARRSGPTGRVAVYASWNGATRRGPLAGAGRPPSATSLDAGLLGRPQRLRDAHRRYRPRPPTFAVRALDANGRVLATRPGEARRDERRDRLVKRVLPRVVVIAQSQFDAPARAGRRGPPRLGRRGRVELYFAFDDPCSAVAVLDLAERLRTRRVDLLDAPGRSQRGIRGRSGRRSQAPLRASTTRGGWPRAAARARARARR